MTNETNATEPNSQANAPASAESSFSIPEAYKDKGWVEKIKSPEDLWKTLDNAQTLIGKRPAGIPSDNASDDEWNQFYKAAGRPDEPKYNLSDPEGLPEGFDTQSFKDQASQILHAAGLNTKQANKVYQEYLKLELGSAAEKQAKQAEQQKALDAEFEKLTQEHFGERFDSLSQSTKEAFGKYVPQDLKESIADIEASPKALAATIAVVEGLKKEIDRVKKEYGAEGSIVSGDQSSSQGIEETRRELATLRTSRAATDFTSPDNKKTMERIAQLQDTVTRFYNKK